MKRIKYKNFEICTCLDDDRLLIHFDDLSLIQCYIVFDISRSSIKQSLCYLSKELKIVNYRDLLPNMKKIFKLFYFNSISEAKKCIDAYLESKNFIKKEEMEL